MLVALLVLSPPDTGDAHRHAIGFAEAVLHGGHELSCVFFQDAGVLTALSGCETPQDEPDLRARWQALAREHGVSLFACVASAARFGVSGPGARSQDGDGGTSRLLPGFTVGGLGELIDASRRSDRLLTFAD